MKILVFGNPLVKDDSIPLRLLPRLEIKFPNIEFKEIDPTEELSEQGKHLIILDSVGEIERVMILDSIEQLHTNKIYSMHDFDLAYNLKLLKKIGQINSVKIIGVPMQITDDDALNQVQSIIRKCAAQLMHGS